MVLFLSSNRADLVADDPGLGDLFLNPFIGDSAHHRPIGSGAIFASGDHPSIANWAAPSGFNVNTGSPYGRLAHKVDNTSQRVTIERNPTHEDPYLDIPATNIAYPVTGVTFAGATNNNDSVVVFINSDTGEHCEFRECGPGGTTRLPSNPMLAGSMHRSWVDYHGAMSGKNSGLGHGTFLGDRVGHSAAGVAALFGLLRGADLTGDGPILHVLQMSIPGSTSQASDAGGPQKASKVIVLPATSRDGYASKAEHCNGEIPYGGIMSLPHGFDITTFGFNTLQLKVAAAIRDFGLMMVDTAGACTIRADQAVTAAQATQVRAVLNTLRLHMRLILNSAWDPNNRRKPTGGGTPRAPNGAYDA